jgi:hypothetical protein
MKDSLIGAILLFLFASCAKVNFPAVFASKKSPYQLSIDSNGTFSYQYHPYEHSYKFSSGKWIQKSPSELRLFSNFKDRKLNMNVSEEITNSNQFAILRIKIDIEESQKPYYELIVYSDGKFATSRKCDSIANISVMLPLESIEFKITADARMPSRTTDTLSTVTYSVKNKNSNLYNVSINYNDSLFNYEVIDGEILKLRSNSVRYRSAILPKMY